MQQQLSSAESTDLAEGVNLQSLRAGHNVQMDQSSSSIRSTIALAFSHDSKYFASTHSDHHVRVFSYPSEQLLACLEGHPRTPWCVKFHPRDSQLIASACLGGECRVWHLPEKKCVARCKMESSVSSLSFNLDGSVLAISSRQQVYLWWYTSQIEQGGQGGDEVEPEVLLDDSNPLHFVEFDHSGTLLMTGRKNHRESIYEQMTLQISVYRILQSEINLRTAIERQGDSRPIYQIDRVIAYNYAGVSICSSGKKLVACMEQTQDEGGGFMIAVVSLVAEGDISVGDVLHKVPLDTNHTSAITNLKFSPSGKHILAGYSFRLENELITSKDVGSEIEVVHIYDDALNKVNALLSIKEANGSVRDRINAAMFTWTDGTAEGVIIGNDGGTIRRFDTTGK